uniref:Uncharacterized protein n=1 Tax=Timema shepardi TaxID=629360 RepID=A0A7R9G5W4_TIMSH|nr:unnamed protein product [Timema shepardi]
MFFNGWCVVVGRFCSVERKRWGEKVLKGFRGPSDEVCRKAPKNERERKREREKILYTQGRQSIGSRPVAKSRVEEVRVFFSRFEVFRHVLGCACVCHCHELSFLTVSTKEVTGLL